MMRALTLTQPWCGLVASGIKLVENRPRSIIKREDFSRLFALHASREIDESVYDRIEEIDPSLALLPSFMMTGTTLAAYPAPAWYRLSRITGAVIAVATIEMAVAQDGEDVIVTRNRRHPGRVAHTIDLGDQRRWFFGPIGYVLCDVCALPTPVPCRGRQGFWTLPPDVAARVEEQLR